MPTDIVRVLHLPFRTPYVQKLVAPSIHVVNGSCLPDGEVVPDDVTFEWLAGRDSFDFFDVLHIHFFEFSPVEVINAVLEKCVYKKRRVVATIHDLSPMFNDSKEAFENKLRKICSACAGIIALTEGSANKLIEIVNLQGIEARLSVIPHGFVLDPGHRLWGKGRPCSHTVVYALYGSFRPNRDTYTLLLNWVYGLQEFDVQLKILCRPLSPCDLESQSLMLNEVFGLIESNNSRVRIAMRPFPTDEEVVEFLAECDVLIMPYRWGTHSGQLELAFDLNLIPVIADNGYYAEQWQQSSPHVPEPLWFNWSDGKIYSYGSRLLEVLIAAHSRIRSGQHVRADESYRRHRLSEHARILQAHLNVYLESGR
jgi:glycosyltransferase involved in cell wall biosynthesis